MEWSKDVNSSNYTKRRLNFQSMLKVYHIFIVLHLYFVPFIYLFNEMELVKENLISLISFQVMHFLCFSL